MNDRTYTRRTFLQRGMTFVSLASTAPMFLQRSALGMALPEGSPLSSRPGVPEDRVLVMVQLGGGNDGLNTVVPYGDRVYYARRPTLAIAAPGGEGGALELDRDAGIGLHPDLAGLKTLIDDGAASILQGVGYPNPNRSHFTSMDIWHTGSTSGQGNGWLGRYVDCACQGRPDPQPSVAIGRTAPLALTGDRHKPVSFESAELFRWVGEDLHASLKKPYDAINRRGPMDETAADGQLDFLLRTALDAQVSSERIRAAVGKQPLVPYPRSGLARQLRIVDAMIRDGLTTRIYYVSIGGFDTHANQAPAHRTLMRQVGDALLAFHRNMKAQGNSGRVLTAVFSEFGRRVGQNASGGTDHGTAAPMYFVGDMVRPGLLGRHPSLTDLDGGDLKHTVDFRRAYAAIIDDWMGGDSRQVLDGSFEKVPLLR